MCVSHADSNFYVGRAAGEVLFAVRGPNHDDSPNPTMKRVSGSDARLTPTFESQEAGALETARLAGCAGIRARSTYIHVELAPPVVRVRREIGSPLRRSSSVACTRMGS